MKTQEEIFNKIASFDFVESVTGNTQIKTEIKPLFSITVRCKLILKKDYLIQLCDLLMSQDHFNWNLFIKND